nr:unnamed protein product [Callosobruchus chinensis]
MYRRTVIFSLTENKNLFEEYYDPAKTE